MSKFKFSEKSMSSLNTCNHQLLEIFNEVIKYFDCSVLTGFRDKEKQDKAFREGWSLLKFPKSKHNQFPSMAIDVVPYPIPEKWGVINFDDKIDKIKIQIKELHKFYYFAGFVLGVAAAKGIKLKFGGDWDGDQDFNDQSFDDLVHFELVED